MECDVRCRRVQAVPDREDSFDSRLPLPEGRFDACVIDIVLCC